MKHLSKKNPLRLAVLGALLALPALFLYSRPLEPVQAAAPAALVPINHNLVRVLVANIRVPEPADTGKRAWGERREALLHTLLNQEPDILGMQEVSPAQGAYLLKNLTQLQLVPHTNDQGGAFAPLTDLMDTLNQLYFRADRWTLASYSSGNIRPEAPQTPITENAHYSLAVLQDKSKTLPDLIVIDAHLRHGVPNAIACAARLHTYIEDQMKLHPGSQAIVMGDMNYDLTSPIYPPLRGEKSASELFDTFDYSKKAPAEKWGTWHAFTGKPIALWPTDLIFTTAGLKAQSAAEIIRDSDHGTYPSDHFFVKTTLTTTK